MPGADHPVAVVFLGHPAEGRLDDATPQAKYQVDFFWVLSPERAAILRPFAHKNQMLLIRGDALLALEFGFDILSSISGLDLEDDGLACRGLHKDLHASLHLLSRLVEEKEHATFFFVHYLRDSCIVSCLRLLLITLL